MALAAGLIILHSVIQQHEITADHLVQQVEAIHPEALVLLSMPSHHASKEWIQIGMPCCGEKDTAFQRECCTRCVQSGVMMEKFEESTLSLSLPLQSYPSVVLVPSRQSLQEHYEMGMILEQTARYLDRKVVVVARIGFPAGEKPGHPQQGSAEFHWERTLMKCVTSGASGELFDLEASAASPEQAAVLRMMAMMAGMFDRRNVICRERTDQSKDHGGGSIHVLYPGRIDPERDFGRQAAAARHRREVTAAQSMDDVCVRLVRQALTQYVQHGIPCSVPELLPPDLLTKQAGCFVTLKKEGQLRGRAGSLVPTKDNVAQEIMAAAVRAGTADANFCPVREAELDQLVYPGRYCCPDAGFPGWPAKSGAAWLKFVAAGCFASIPRLPSIERREVSDVRCFDAFSDSSSLDRSR